MTVAYFLNTKFESLAAGPLPYCQDLETAKDTIGGFNVFQRFFCKVDEQAHVAYQIKKEHFITTCEGLCGMPFREPRAPPGEIQGRRRITRNGKRSTKVGTQQQVVASHELALLLLSLDKEKDSIIPE